MKTTQPVLTTPLPGRRCLRYTDIRLNSSRLMRCENTRIVSVCPRQTPTTPWSVGGWICQIPYQDTYAAKWQLDDAKKRIIKSTIEWRRSYQPDLIAPEEVRLESETGKLISPFLDPVTLDKACGLCIIIDVTFCMSSKKIVTIGSRSCGAYDPTHFSTCRLMELPGPAVSQNTDENSGVQRLSTEKASLLAEGTHDFLPPEPLNAIPAAYCRGGGELAEHYKFPASLSDLESLSSTPKHNQAFNQIRIECRAEEFQMIPSRAACLELRIGLRSSAETRD
ncbi:hypothetical protein B0H14DRAFT_2622263 [Mycena olivaceomarginata]|nr:hypothetical protein B0H14DRAFT_2622263 [Mycena olivaceomarginata]